MTDQPEKNIPDKKIIIDEDWKTQVEAEREAARRAKEAAAPEDTKAPHPGPLPEEEGEPAVSTGQASAPGPGGPHIMPPASFGMLVTTLATEAMVGLGQIPRPGEAQPRVELEAAKYFIDTLAVLEEKTKGNLSPEEATALEDVLHQLRMAYVAVQQRP